MTKEKLIYLAIVIVFCGGLISYFARPRAPHLELVSPEQISPGAFTSYSAANPNLADRVLNSYGMALVLVQSPYSPDNTLALESLRSWARENFLADRGFLHPVSLEDRSKRTDTVFGALSYSIFGGPYYWLHSRVGDLVKNRVAAYQETPSYISISDTYFELFGDDPEAAVLLARYQSDRAKHSLDVVLATFVWAAAAVAGMFYIFSADGRKMRLIRLRQSLGVFWLMLSAAYFISASAHNDVSTCLAAMLSLGTGLYALRPVVLQYTQKGITGASFTHVNPTLIAVVAWGTFTLIAIQVISWMRTPLNPSPDPLTLLISAFTGDFMHDHSGAKQLVKYSMGVLWLLMGTWVMWVRHRDGQSFVEDRLLESLEAPTSSREEVLIGQRR